MITVGHEKTIKDQSNFLSLGKPSVLVSVLIPSQGQGQPLLLLLAILCFFHYFLTTTTTTTTFLDIAAAAAY